MYSNLSNEFKWQRITIATAVLTCMTIVYAAAGCGPNEAIIHDCSDPDVADGGDAGNDAGSGKNEDPYCNEY